MIDFDGAGNKSRYAFEKNKWPTLLSLACLTGPMMFFCGKDGKHLAEPDMLLEKIPGRFVKGKEWTPIDIECHNAMFIKQVEAIILDLDERLKRAPRSERDGILDLQNNLRATVQREKRE